MQQNSNVLKNRLVNFLTECRLRNENCSLTDADIKKAIKIVKNSSKSLN